MIGKLIGFVVMGIMMAEGLFADVQIVAKVDRQDIPLYQKFNYDIEISGDQLSDLPSVTLPDLNRHLQVVSQSQSSSVRIINGVVSAQVTYRFGIVPQAEGAFTIGASKLVIKGESYQTNPIRITVSKPIQPQAASSPDSSYGPVFLRAQVDRKSVYIGQDITYTLVMYRRVNLWDQLTLQSAPQFEGVYAVELQVNPNPVAQTIGGTRYLSQELIKKRLTPLKAGTLTLPQIEVGYVANPFDGRELAMADALQITVLPLPAAPESRTFSGLIGRFKVEMSELPQTMVSQNAALTMTLRVSGSQPLDRLTELDVSANENFKVYKSAVKDIKGAGGHVRQFDYVVIPKRPGRWPFPEFALTTFSPEEKKYITQTTPPYFIEVKADATEAYAAVSKSTSSSGRSSAQGASSSPSTAPKPVISSESRYLKPYTHKDGIRLSKNPVIWAELAAILALLSMLGYRTAGRFLRTEKPSHQPKIDRLKALPHPFSETHYAALHQLILDACTETFSRPFNPLSHQEIEAFLRDQNLPDQVISEVLSCLEKSSYSAYAPGDKPDSQRLVSRVIDLLKYFDQRRAST